MVHPPRHEFAERIKSQLARIKRSKAWLASEVGISRQAMNWLLNHAKKPKYLTQIALALEVDPEWLRSGEGKVGHIGEKTLAYKIAILSHEDILAGKYLKAYQIKTDHYLTADGKVTGECYAVLLDNKSMEPNFPDGAHLIFKPAHEAKRGDFVLAKIKETNKLVFRQYLVDGSGIYLRPLDHTYKSQHISEVEIVGILMQYRVSFEQLN